MEGRSWPSRLCIDNHWRTCVVLIVIGWDSCPDLWRWTDQCRSFGWGQIHIWGVLFTYLLWLDCYLLLLIRHFIPTSDLMILNMLSTMASHFSRRKCSSWRLPKQVNRCMIVWKLGHLLSPGWRIVLIWEFIWHNCSLIDEEINYW